MSRATAVWTVGDLAERFDLELVTGPRDAVISGVSSLESGNRNHLVYAGGASHLKALRTTAARAVIVPAELADEAPGAVLVAEQPQLAFARVAALFDYQPSVYGIHPSALLASGIRLGEDVSIGPNAVIGVGCVIGAKTRIGANTVLDDGVTIGKDGQIGANVSIGHHVRIGERVRIAPGAVIGARGFGLVHNGNGWEPIPQLGSVVLGDGVEIGASTSVDRGALDDTIIDDDVHIDNQVQIGHNCRIGAHTVIAGAAGIAGSCHIGANCMIGGGVGIGDHLTIVDGVIITAASQVPHDIAEAGVWSSTFRAMPAGQWRRLLARFRKLGRFEQRLKRLEKKLGTSDGVGSSPDNREHQD